MNNFNIFIKRVKKYNPNGRNQTAEEAENISVELKKILDRLGINYAEIEGNEQGLNALYTVCKNYIKNSK